MKVMTVIASSEGFGDENYNDTKMALLDNILTNHYNNEELIVLPAGFFYLSDKNQTTSIISRVKRRVKNAKVSILFGIDNGKKIVKYDLAKKRLYKMSRDHELPFWGYYISASGKQKEFQQTSTNKDDALVGEEYFIASDQIISIRSGNRDFKVAVLMCGELFSESSREKIENLKPNLIVDLGHLGMSRFTRSMKVASRKSGAPVLHCHHVSSIYTSKLHCIGINQTNKNDNNNQFSVCGIRIKNKKVIAKYAIWEMIGTKPYIKCVKGNK